MPKPLFSYTAFIFLSCSVFSQTNISVSSGISIDINNQRRFRQVPLSFEWMTGKSKMHQLIFKADVGIPLPNQSYDSAYTTAGGLPQAIAIKKKIQNNWFSLSMGGRFFVRKQSEANYFFIDFFPLGISQQKFKIIYKNYDNADYEVINPDVGLNRWSFVSSLGIGYIRNNFTGQVHLQTPLLASEGPYRLSYKFNAPLQITIGYLFKLSKNR